MSGIEFGSPICRVTKKDLSSTTPESANNQETGKQSPIVIKRGRLTLTPITADSSWYQGIAAVTAETMPRAFWQPTGDLQVQIDIFSVLSNSKCFHTFFGRQWKIQQYTGVLVSEL